MTLVLSSPVSGRSFTACMHRRIGVLRSEKLIPVAVRSGWIRIARLSAAA
jgi:hypothetical protein